MSMADSTACSASSEYGGRRSRYGSRAAEGAIEYSTGELDIFPGGALPGGVPQQRGGVVRDDQGHPIIAMNLSPQLPDGKLRVQQSLRGECAECDDDFRANELDLTYQVRPAGRNLFGARVSVPRRPVLQHVADEYVLPLELDCPENFLEKLAGLADEWAARFVLCRARCLSDEHEVRIGVAFARYRVFRGGVKWASRARRDCLLQGFERVEPRAAGAKQFVGASTDTDA